MALPDVPREHVAPNPVSATTLNQLIALARQGRLESSDSIEVVRGLESTRLKVRAVAVQQMVQAATSHPWNVKRVALASGQLVVVVNGRDGFGATVNGRDAQIGGNFCVPRSPTAPVPYLSPTADGVVYVELECDAAGTQVGYPQVKFLPGYLLPDDTETRGHLRVATVTGYSSEGFTVTKDRSTPIAWVRCGADTHVWGAG